MTGTQCLSFKFHMRGPGTGSLRINQMSKKNSRPRVVWYRVGDQGGDWNEARLNLFGNFYRVCFCYYFITLTVSMIVENENYSWTSIKGPSFGVPGNERLMEGGRSIEFRHKLAKSLAEISLSFLNNFETGTALLVHNRSSPSISDCIFRHHSLGVTSAWWPLNGGDNNGRILVGKTKRWPQPLNRGLISHSFLQLFRVFYHWPLNAGLLLNRWSLNGRLTV